MEVTYLWPPWLSGSYHPRFVDALRSDYKGVLYLSNAVTTFVKFVFIFMNNIYFLLTFNLVRAASVATSDGFIFMGRTPGEYTRALSFLGILARTWKDIGGNDFIATQCSRCSVAVWPR